MYLPEIAEQIEHKKKEVLQCSSASFFYVFYFLTNSVTI